MQFSYYHRDHLVGESLESGTNKKMCLVGEF